MTKKPQPVERKNQRAREQAQRLEKIHRAARTERAVDAARSRQKQKVRRGYR